MDHKKLRKPSEIRRDASGKFAKRETAAEILTCADSARVGDWTAAGKARREAELLRRRSQLETFGKYGAGALPSLPPALPIDAESFRRGEFLAVLGYNPYTPWDKLPEETRDGWQKRYEQRLALMAPEATQTLQTVNDSIAAVIVSPAGSECVSCGLEHCDTHADGQEVPEVANAGAWALVWIAAVAGGVAFLLSPLGQSMFGAIGGGK